MIYAPFVVSGGWSTKNSNDNGDNTDDAENTTTVHI